METLSAVFWGLSLLITFFSSGKVKIGGRPVRNPITRVIIMMVVLLLVGLLFMLFGLLGEFILLAPKALFQ